MSSDWPKVKIDDIKAKSNSSIAIGPFGSRMKADNYSETGTPVIRGNNLSGGREFEGDFVYVPDSFADTMPGCLVYKDDLVFPHRGAIGHVGIVPDDKDRYIISTSLMKLTVNKEIVYPEYVYHFFKSYLGRYELLKNASTVGTPGIGTPLTSLRNIEMPLPPLSAQRQIINILSSLDDKIELNRRMNRTLEQMARALFQSWFVDFDPVRAKMRGEMPEGMDPETAALFPDALEEVEGREIPVGWRWGTVGDIAHVIDCLHSKKPNQVDNGRPYIQLNNISNCGTLDLSEIYKISEEDYSKWTSRIEVGEGDCIITNVGRVGAICRIPQGFKGAIGRNITAIRMKKECDYPIFLIEILLSDFMKKEINSKTDAGTILNALNVKNIPKLSVMLPGIELIHKFDNIVRPIRKGIEDNIYQNKMLERMRDELLPRLLSGELDVSGWVEKENPKYGVYA